MNLSRDLIFARVAAEQMKDYLYAEYSSTR